MQILWRKQDETIEQAKLFPLKVLRSKSNSSSLTIDCINEELEAGLSLLNSDFYQVLEADKDDYYELLFLYVNPVDYTTLEKSYLLSFWSLDHAIDNAVESFAAEQKPIISLTFEL